MKVIQDLKLNSKWIIFFVIGFLFLFLNIKKTDAQTFNELQALDFGYFLTSGNGGSLIINHDTGIATDTKNVIIVSGQAMGIYDCTITSAKSIHLTYPGNVRLNGSGGKYMTLTLNDNGSSHNFNLVNGYVKVNFGGTLNVGKLSDNPVGVYSNVFYISYTVAY